MKYCGLGCALGSRVKPVESGCHEWQGSLASTGYGVLHYETKTLAVHRLAWSFANGPIPDGLIILHSCDNRRCVNPAHLSVGTYAQNAQDASARKRLPRGEKRARAKLTEGKVRFIRDNWASRTHGQREMARMLGISRHTVRCIINRETWAWLA